MSDDRPRTLQEERDDFVEALGELRDALFPLPRYIVAYIAFMLGTDFGAGLVVGLGWHPDRQPWVLVLVAIAVGVAIVVGVKLWERVYAEAR